MLHWQVVAASFNTLLQTYRLMIQIFTTSNWNEVPLQVACTTRHTASTWRAQCAYRLLLQSCRAALQLIIFSSRSRRRLEGRSDSFAQVMYRAMDDAMYTTRGKGMSPEGADNALKGAHNRVKDTQRSA